MLVIGAVLSLSLPKARKKDNLATKTSLSEGFEKTKELFRRKGLTAAYSSIFAQYFAFGGVVTLLPLYIKNLGMEAFHVGMLLAIFAIMFIILQFPGGALSDRLERLMPAVTGLSLSVASLVMLPQATTFPLLAAVMALYGAGYGVLFPSISVLVADHTTHGERGLATGLFHALLTAGVALGAPIMGWAGGITGVKTALSLSAIILVLALAVALINIRRGQGLSPG